MSRGSGQRDRFALRGGSRQALAISFDDAIWILAPSIKSLGVAVFVFITALSYSPWLWPHTVAHCMCKELHVYIQSKGWRAEPELRRPLATYPGAGSCTLK